LTDKERDGHDHTAYTNIRTQSFADPGELPEYAKDSIFVSIHNPRHHAMSVRGGTYDEQDDQKERLEIEEGGHFGRDG